MCNIILFYMHCIIHTMSYNIVLYDSISYYIVLYYIIAYYIVF